MDKREKMKIAALVAVNYYLQEDAQAAMLHQKPSSPSPGAAKAHWKSAGRQEIFRSRSHWNKFGKR